MLSRKRSTLQPENKGLFISTILNRVIDEAIAQAEYNIYQKGAAAGFMELVDFRASILQTVMGLIYREDSLQSRVHVGSDTEPQPSTFDNQIYGKVAFIKLPTPKSQIRLTRTDLKNHVSLIKATRGVKKGTTDIFPGDNGSVGQNETELRQTFDSQSEIPNSNPKRTNRLVPVPLNSPQTEDAEDKYLMLQHYIKTKSNEVATAVNSAETGDQPHKENTEVERIRRINADFSKSNINKPKDDKLKVETRSLFYQSK